MSVDKPLMSNKRVCGRGLRLITGRQQLTYLTDELDLDAVVLQPLSRIFECDINLPRHRFTVIEEKISVLPAVFAFMLCFLSRFGVIQNYIDLRTLTKTKDVHRDSSLTLCRWIGTIYVKVSELNTTVSRSDVANRWLKTSAYNCLTAHAQDTLALRTTIKNWRRLELRSLFKKKKF